METANVIVVIVMAFNKLFVICGGLSQYTYVCVKIVQKFVVLDVNYDAA